MEYQVRKINYNPGYFFTYKELKEMVNYILDHIVDEFDHIVINRNELDKKSYYYFGYDMNDDFDYHIQFDNNDIYLSDVGELHFSNYKFQFKTFNQFTKIIDYILNYIIGIPPLEI